MSIWIVVMIITLVLGLIIGNILLLKQSANLKMPKVSKDNNASYDRFDEKDDWALPVHWLLMILVYENVATFII